MQIHPVTLLLTMLATWPVVQAANIVIYLAVGSKSHKFVFMNYANELVRKGHQVTMISSTSVGQPEAIKFQDIVPKKMSELLSQNMDKLDVFRNRVESIIMKPVLLLPFASVMVCETFLDSPEVSDLIEGGRKVDLLVIDPLANDCAWGLVHVYQAPAILFSTTGMMSTMTNSLGLPTGALFSPSLMVPRMVDVSSVWHRMASILSEVGTNLVRRYYVHPQVRALWEKRLGRTFPSFEDMERNASFVLLNTHPAVDFPSPQFSYIVQVGGIHLKPNKPLPKDLQNITGVDFVLFSLGSIAQAKDMPEIYFQHFVEAFKKLPYRILWKLESDQEINLPPNVFTGKWLPQADLLAHPKCRAFVTHGGKLSMFEALSHGIPLVVIPFFADQDLHAHLAQQSGFGIHLDVSQLTSESLLQAIRSVVEDPSFRIEAEKRSQMLKDQLDSPLDRAIFWTEFVIRNNEADHLKPLARNFNWLQYHLVDVIFVIFFVIFSFVLAVAMTVNSLYMQIIKMATKVKVKKTKSQ